MNIGEIERDTDGFEDINQYLNDDVFISPPPAISQKPPSKAKSRTPVPPKKFAVHVDDFDLEDDDGKFGNLT